MPLRDLIPLPRRSVRHGPGLLALGLSLGVHGGALAGFFLLREATPSEPLPIMAIELVSAGKVAGPPAGLSASQGETVATVKGLPDLDPAGSAESMPILGDDGSSAMPLAEPEPEPEQHPPPGQTATLQDAAPVFVSDRTHVGEASPAPELRNDENPPAPRRKPQVTTQSLDRNHSASRIEPETTQADDPPKPTTDRKAAQVVTQSGDAGTAASEPPTTTLGVSRGDTASSTTSTMPSGEDNEVPAGNPKASPKFTGGGLSNAPPRYPYLARRRGQEGRVVLLVQVSAAGDAVAVRLRESSGHRLLDEAAVEAVKTWRFIPANRAGQAVSGSVAVPVSFRLED